MIIRLPELQWRSSIWRLPLGPRSAAALAIALLEERPLSLRRVTQLMSVDPALLLWVVCQAPDWKDAPPPGAEAAAAWFLESAVPSGLLNRLECDPATAPAAGKEVPATDPAPDAEYRDSAGSRGTNSSGNWAVVLLSHAFVQFQSCGPDVTGASLRDAPWFPAWVPIHNDAPLGGMATVADECGERWEAALLPLVYQLPRIVRQVHRLHELETRFAAALERDKIAAMRELAYGASHEINNPLANIAARAQSLMRDELHPERRRKLATIEAQAFRAHEMIADMMLFAKPPALRLGPVDVPALVSSIAMELRSEAESQGTSIRVATPPALTISADPTQLGVAVKALVRNALEALVSDGHVEITVAEPSSDRLGQTWIEIQVRDSGPGISDEVRGHLFDPFYSGREAGRGLGFGLPKSWTIARLHGGEVLVSSEVGQGSTVTLRLPLLPAEPARPERA